MGFIRDDFGRIAIETRRESFIIHAAYGYSPARVPVGELPLGARLTWPGCPDEELRDRVLRVRAQHEDYTLVVDEQFSTERNLPRSTEVHPFDYEDDFDEKAPLAGEWRDYPHPEFAFEDISDLIAALVDARDDRV